MSTKTSLNRKEDFWSWWCYRAWILFSLCFAGVMTAIILYYWNDWSIQLKGVAAISVILPIHVVEEWVFPGGFHYQYNTFAFHSDIPDRYPMCRVSDTITNLSGTFLFAGLALWGVVGLLVMLLGCIISPEKLTKSRDTRFVFPSAGYYDRFRKENGNIDKNFRKTGKSAK